MLPVPDPLEKTIRRGMASEETRPYVTSPREGQVEDSPGASPPYLAWAGLSRSVDLSPEDVEAMDIALALVPELRLAALAIVRAREMEVTYPITSGLRSSGCSATMLALRPAVITSTPGRFVVSS
jgi:hypothetical protein